MTPEGTAGYPTPCQSPKLLGCEPILHSLPHMYSTYQYNVVNPNNKSSQCHEPNINRRLWHWLAHIHVFHYSQGEFTPRFFVNKYDVIHYPQI